MRYRCKESFAIDKYDEDGNLLENEQHVVEAGELYEISSSTIIGGEIHLDNVNKTSWLELSKESLNGLFEEVYIREELLEVAKPILFNSDMVRAILEERKTVTRRAVKKSAVDSVLSSPVRIENSDIPDYKVIECLCTMPCEPGDILYVRETWTYHENAVGGVIFKARCPEKLAESKQWKPSIHMPKEVARIFLKVTDVRVERLQDMPHDGAMKEGIHYDECPDGFTWKPHTDMNNCYTNPTAAMKALWDSTIKKKDLDTYGWEANPWVWVIEFKRVEVEPC